MQAMTETECVEAYRVEEFLRMGFQRSDAELMAASDADLHRVEDMIKAGCQLQLALIISL